MPTHLYACTETFLLKYEYDSTWRSWGLVCGYWWGGGCSCVWGRG